MEKTALQSPELVSGTSGVIVLNSWNDLLFLAEEPDRYGKTVCNIRLKFGSRPPWRYGPYDSKGAAKKAFTSMVKDLHSQLLDVACNLGWPAGCAGNEEF